MQKKRLKRRCVMPRAVAGELKYAQVAIAGAGCIAPTTMSNVAAVIFAL